MTSADPISPTPLELAILRRRDDQRRSELELDAMLLAYSVETRAAIQAASGSPDVPSYAEWLTAIPGGLPADAQEATTRMHWGQETWWPGRTLPFEAHGDEPGLTGTYYGFQRVDAGHEPTLWFANAYNLYGVIQDLEAWRIGDFGTGREGHFLYLRCVPSLDMTIRRCRARCIGGQAIQREWRLTETDIPADVWQGGGGTFAAEDCDFREAGLLDYGSAPRSSWDLALYSTMQHTIVRRVTVVDYWSLQPHSGALLVGYGQAGFRTPDVLVEDCVFLVRQGDRAIAFFQACNEVTLRRTTLRGGAPYVDITDDCGPITVEDMPQDTLVRIHYADHPFNAPYRTEAVPAGQSRTIVVAPESAAPARAMSGVRESESMPGGYEPVYQ